MQQQQRELEYYNQQRSLSGMGMDGNGGGNQLLPSFGMDHGNGGGKLPPSSGMYASSFNTSAKPAAIDDAYHNDERLSKLVKLNKVREAAKEKEGKGK